MTAGGGQGWPGQGHGYDEQSGGQGWQQPSSPPAYPNPGQPSYPAPDQQSYPAPGQPPYGQQPYGQPGYPTSGQPVYPAPGQPAYGPPGQPTYPYPGTGTPDTTATYQGYGASPTGTQQVFGAPGYGQQPPTAWQPPTGPGAPGGPGWSGGPGGPGTPPPAPGGGAKKSNLPVIITAIAVVVALLAAGLVWFIARKSSDDAAGGQSTPVDATTQLLSSLTSKDAIGIAEGLDPTEAHLVADMSGDVLTQLKRLGIVNDSVSASSTGTTVTTSGLTFNPTPIAINDHVSVVELTGGTVTVTSGSGTLPFSDKLLDAFPELKEQAKVSDTTINITDEVAKLGHPIRIATVDREGKWYVSLFYTAADNAAYAQNPSYQLGTPIPDTGGATPEDAMNTLLDKAVAGDISGVIGVLSPDEMGVLHDYGSLIVNEAGSSTGDLGDATLSDVSWNVSDVTGGKKVSIKSLTINSGGQKFVIERDPAAGSLTVQAPGQGTVNITQDNIGTWITENSDAHLDAQVMDIIKREFPQVIGLGVVMVQAGDGKWYVSPLRTYSDVMVSLLKGLEPADIDYFISLAQGK